MTEPLDLTPIEARATAATDGPWEHHPEIGPCFLANVSGPYLRGVGDFNFGVGAQAEADEEFVRHAQPDVIALIAEVKRLRAAAQAESDEQRADREETERDHARGDHTYCGITCDTEMPTEHLRNFVIAKGYPGTAGALDELLRRARATAPSAPADQDLRDRIAHALAEVTVGHKAFITVDVEAEYPRVDAVLAVLPAYTDEAAERPLSPYYEHPACGFHWHGRDGMDVPVRDGQPVCPRCELQRLADEAQQAEPIVTVHAAPNLSPDAKEALGALIDVAKAQMTDEAQPSGPCPQHPNAPTFDGQCGGCTQYPADMIQAQQAEHTPEAQT